MKTGICPVCHWRMVVVGTYGCGCGGGHRRAADCSRPVAGWVVRAHACGRGHRPLEVRELA